MKTITSILLFLLFSVSLFSQIDIFQIERYNKTLDVRVAQPGLSLHFPTGLIYQDTSGSAFTNLSDEILRIADGPIGFQLQSNQVIYTEVTKNSFSINHFNPNIPDVFFIGPSRRGNWGPRDLSNPFFYDFNTFGDIYNINLSGHRLAELTDNSGTGALRLHRYTNDFTYNHTLTINDAGVPVWLAISDRNAKENIVDADDVLSRVVKLEMKDYNYKGLAESTRGYIAQEVQEIFPEMVSETEGGLLAIDYLGFGVLAVQAIKEQHEIISSLEERLEKIEALLAEK